MFSTCTRQEHRWTRQNFVIVTQHAEAHDVHDKKKDERETVDRKLHSV